MLLNFDNDTNDSSSKNQTITKVWNANVSVVQSKFGWKSLYLDWAWDYLNIAQTNDFAFWTGDYTVDFWFYSKKYDNTYWTYFSTSNYQILWMHRRRTWAWNWWNLQVYSSWGYKIYDFKPSSIDTWYHAAVVRKNWNVDLYINGIKRNVITTYSNLSGNITADPWVIGYNSQIGTFFGNIDEFRVSNTARWTENFTPPTWPYN